MLREAIRSMAAVLVAGVLALGPGVAHAAAPAEQWPDLTTPVAKQGGGERDAAVIIAISDYVFAPDVAGATDNAEAWYRHLTSTRGVPVQNVRLLRDNEATLEEMRGTIDQAAKQVGEGGTLWFVFIGHGSPSKSGKDGLLVGVDAQQTAASLEARSLHRSELLSTLESGQGQPVVILDACFSGLASDGGSIAEGLQPMRLADLEQPNSSVVLTAARSNQYAGALPGKDVPAFSYLLLGAIRGWGDDDGDGTVSASEALLYSSNAMRTLIKGRAQTPELSGPGAQASLGRAGEAGPDLASIVVGSGPMVDKGPDKAPPPEPAGGECVDNRGCPTGTSCQAGICRTDYVYRDQLERKATTRTRAGAVIVGIGGVLLITGAVLVPLAVKRTIDNDTGSIAGWSLIGIGVLGGGVLGGVLLGSGLAKRRQLKALSRSTSPQLSLAPGGMQLRF